MPLEGYYVPLVVAKFG